MSPGFDTSGPQDIVADLEPSAPAASMEQMRALLDALAEGVVFQTSDGVIQTCNPAAERILGLSAAQIRGRTSMDPRWRAIHPDGAPFPGETHPAIVALRTGKPRSNVLMGIHKPDGVLTWIVINARPLIHPGESRPYGVVTSFADVTEQVMAQTALVERESQLRAIIDNEPECVKVVGMDGRLLDMNPAGLAMIEADSLRSVRGMHVGDLVLAEDRPAYQQLCEQTVAEGRGFARFRMRGLKGTARCMESHTVTLRDAAGQATSVLSVTRDVTEQRSAEDALRDSEARYRLLADSMDDFVSLSSRDGRLLYVSPSFFRATGYSMAEVEAADFRSRVHPDDLSSLERAVVANRNGQTTQVMYRYRFRNGHYAWLETRAVPIPDAEGIVTQVLSCSRDVTERKNAELALRESEERYRLLADSMEDFVGLSDMSGRQLYVSPSFFRASGYQMADIRGEKCHMLIHPDDLVAVEAASVENAAGRQTQIVYRYRFSNGEYVWLETRAVPIRDKQGRVENVVYCSRDVSERQRAEIALRDSEARLELLVEQRTRELAASQERLRLAERLASIGNFAAGVAHEINNPVGMLVLQAQNLLADAQELNLPDGVRARLMEVDQLSQRCGRIVRSVLTFARRNPMSRQPAALASVVDAAVRQARAYAAMHPVAIHVTTAQTLPVLMLDATGIEQAIVNLLHNAMEAGARRIDIDVSREDQHACIRVTDDGCGMSHEQTLQVFDPFFTTRRDRGGTGLGLSIVHGIVADHGGHTHIESEPWHGTCVSITLPLGSTHPPSD